MKSSAAVITPRKPFMKWVNRTYADQGDERELTPEYFEQNSSIILIPKFLEEKEAKEYINEIWHHIFEQELSRWYLKESIWPKDRTQKMFKQWFKVTFYARVFDCRP